MAIEIVMPKLGWTMEEGVLAEWIKHDGDSVQPGEIIFTVESDKALQEVEAFDSGVLRIPPNSPPVGSTVPVGGLLAFLMQTEGETVTLSDESTGAASRPIESGSSSESSRVQANGSEPTISPRARRIAAELQVDWTVLSGSGRTGRIVERDVRKVAETQAEKNKKTGVEVSPVARRMAEAQGVDLAALAGKNPGRRITREDVERASSKQSNNGAASQETRQPITRTRRLIADRMSQSHQTTAPVTLTTEVDATELVHLRNHLKAVGKQPVPSYNDLFAKLVSVALADHPALNSRLEGDEIIQSSAIHIGLAVDSERGLLVPVIRDTQAKSIRQIAAESAELIETVRSGTLPVDAMSGSTFSITNLGMYEIDAFTPIINLPECAILGIGRIVPKQIVTDAEAGTVAIRQMLFLSLTFDHRVVDGAPAARFMQQVKRFVEQPYLWIID